MKLPQLIDYQQALQIPQVSLTDSDLKRGAVWLNQLRVPDPASGGFALTFSITTDGRRYAVRCFHKLGNHLQDRYAEIANFIRLNQRDLDFLIDVRYVARGILVNGEFYPIVRMPWISGMRLDSWIDEHLYQPDLLDQVRAQLRNAVTKMRSAGVAHGDLQHGNILVDSNTRVWLVDYDGMYLPSLAGLGASEFGHRNYQHPDRGDSYDRDLDLFASAVIDLSLDAIRHDPTLWQATGENLLFEAEDFVAPQRSEVFGKLTRITPLLERTRRLMDACVSDFASVPGILSGERAGVPVVQPAIQRPGPTGPQALPARDRKLLLGRVGDEVPVVGRVVGVYPHRDKGRTTTFINFGNYRNGDFTIVAFDRISRELATTYGERLVELRGAWVSITGLVTSYQAAGRPLTPQIELQRVGSLRILTAEEAAAKLAKQPPRDVRPSRPAGSEPQVPPQHGTYRWSAPPKPQPKRDPMADDVAIQASMLYSKPGFVNTSQGPAPAGATPPNPVPTSAPGPQSQPYPPPPVWSPPPSGPPTFAPPSAPPQHQQYPPPAAPPSGWPYPASGNPPPSQPRRGLWQRLRDRLGL